MPIYEYICTDCDHRADILHGINDLGPHFCPSCGKPGTMRKLFAPPTIHYKGSGWAKKDRGASGARSTKTATGGSSSTSGESGATGAADGGSSSTSGESGASTGAADGAPASTSSTPGSGSGD
jgi:putative FmdB family regulatory protein